MSSFSADEFFESVAERPKRATFRDDAPPLDYPAAAPRYEPFYEELAAPPRHRGEYDPYGHPSGGREAADPALQPQPTAERGSYFGSRAEAAAALLRRTRHSSGAKLFAAGCITVHVTDLVVGGGAASLRHLGPLQLEVVLLGQTVHSFPVDLSQGGAIPLRQVVCYGARAGARTHRGRPRAAAALGARGRARLYTCAYARVCSSTRVHVLPHVCVCCHTCAAMRVLRARGERHACVCKRVCVPTV